ncbi:MAG: Ig-like domain-containing protein, partial [Micrococcales bacterium]|nr:Ig-like domain-containing protein [Micrococcales bacterium]
SLSNVVEAEPSLNTDEIITKADGSFTNGSQQHAVLVAGQAIGITTSTPAGWKLDGGAGVISGQYASGCYSADQTGPTSPPDITGNVLTVPSSLVSAGTAIFCDLTYDALGSDPVAEARLTVSPTPDQAKALIVGAESYAATASLTALAKDGLGGQVSAPLVGQVVTMSLSPNQAAPASGAYFTNGSQQASCTTNSAGQCSLEVFGAYPGTYQLTATTVGYDGSQVAFPTTSSPGQPAHPVNLFFDSSGQICLADSIEPQCSSYSTVRVQNEPVVADDAASGSLSVMLLQAPGMPATGQAAALRATGPKGAGLTISAFSETETPGLYTATFQGRLAGDYQIRFWYNSHWADNPENKVELTTLDTPYPNSLAHLTHGPVDWQRSVDSLTTKASVSLSDGWETGWARVQIQDKFGNPVLDANPICFSFRYGLEAEPGDGPRWVEERLVDPAREGSSRICQVSDLTGVVLVEAVSLYSSVGTPGWEVLAHHQPKPAKPFEVAEPEVWTDTSEQAGGPRYLQFASAEVDLAKSWFTVDQTSPAFGPVVANGVDNYTVTAYLRDTNGHPVNQAAVQVSLTPTGPIGAPYDITSATDGTATVAVTSLLAGSFTVSVSVAAGPLPTPVAGSNELTQIIVFAPGLPNGLASSLTSPLGWAVANGSDSQVVTALVRDGFIGDGRGNPVGGVAVVFRVPGGTVAMGCAEGATVAGGLGEGCTVTTGTVGTELGVARLVLVSTLAGSYEVTAQALGTAIETGSPGRVVFTHGPVSLENSTLQIISLPGSKVAGLEKHLAQVVLRDSFDNLDSSSSAQQKVTLTWTLLADPLHYGSVAVRSVDGLASFEFTDQQAGLYQVDAQVPAGAVKDSPQLVEFVFGPASQASLAVSSGEVLSDGVAAHSGQVLVSDQFGNPVAGQAVELAVTGSAMLNGASGPVRLLTSLSGQVSVSVTNQAHQTVLLSAQIVDQPFAVTDSPASLEFGPGAADATWSNWTVAESTPLDSTHRCVLANGVDSFTGIAQLRSANDLAVDGQIININSDLATVLGPDGPYISDADGLVSVQVTSTKAGVYSFGARLGSSDLNGSPAQVEFCAGPVSSVQSSLEGPKAAALADGFDNQVVTAGVLAGF